MTINKRFKIVVNYLKLKQSQLAEDLNLHRSMISKVLLGHSGVSNDMLNYIHKKYNVNLNWLFDGKGDIFIDGSDIDFVSEPEETYGEKKLVELYEENRQLLKENIRLKEEIQKLKENLSNK